MTRKRITDNLDVLLNVLPPLLATQLTSINRSDDLLEVILDLGRIPTARYVDREETLSQVEATHNDIDYVVERISAFDGTQPVFRQSPPSLCCSTSVTLALTAAAM